MKAGMPHYGSSPPPPTAVFASAHALSELDLLREPFSTAGRTTEEHVLKLESSGAFVLKTEPTYVENAGPQMICVGEGSSVHKRENDEARRAADSALPLSWSRHEPVFVVPSGFTTPPGLALPMGSRPEYWRNELLYRGGDIEKHPGPEPPLSSRQNAQLQSMPPNTALHYDEAAFKV